jgi:hypothetical protein
MRQSKTIMTFVNTPATWYHFVPSFSNSFIQIRIIADVECVDGFWSINLQNMTFPGYFGINFDQANKSFLHELIDQAIIDEYINQKQDQETEDYAY